MVFIAGVLSYPYRLNPTAQNSVFIHRECGSNICVQVLAVVAFLSKGETAFYILIRTLWSSENFFFAPAWPTPVATIWRIRQSARCWHWYQTASAIRQSLLSTYGALQFEHYYYFNCCRRCSDKPCTYYVKKSVKWSSVDFVLCRTVENQSCIVFYYK
jgi:hypothetical protein